MSVFTPCRVGACNDGVPVSIEPRSIELDFPGASETPVFALAKTGFDDTRSAAGVACSIGPVLFVGECMPNWPLFFASVSFARARPTR